MFEMTQAQIARAIDVLRHGPLTAAQFATKMWPDRERSTGSSSRAGHLILRKLGAFGYVERIGDLWTTREFSKSHSNGLHVGPEVVPQVAPQAALGVGLSITPPAGPSAEQQEEQANRLRLQQLVALADAPAAGVTHDVVFGNIRVRGVPLDDCLVEACAFAVLRGRSLNVYPLLGAMIVGLTPVEGARALYLRWRQSGVPPEPPYRGGTRWFILDDGIVASPGSWKPEGADRQWRAPESFIDRVARQRAAAGLGPPVGR